MSASKKEGWVRLGDYIEKFSQKNKDLIPNVSGVNIFKDFFPTVADLNGTDISKYQVVPHGAFACNLMHIGRDAKIPIAFNYSDNPIIISPAYDTFKVSDSKVGQILPDYLIMLFKCREIDRLSWFYCDSSIRGNLQWDRFCDIEIPLPSIEVQRELVSVYNGLKSLAEENEALLQPLSDACQAFIVDCKKKYPEVKLETYIEQCNERNSRNKYTVKDLKGVTADGVFDFSRANTEGLDFSNYKVVRQGSIAYNPSRINLGSIALSDNNCIVSPMYIVFRLKNTEIIPEFINIWFRRKEFQRSTLFYASGSVRDTFDFEQMQKVLIPLPPLAIQQKIVDLYNCYQEAKNIAENAREQLRNICPALIQKAAHSLS